MQIPENIRRFGENEQHISKEPSGKFGSEFKINKQTPEVFTVFLDSVVFLFDMFLIQKSEYVFFQLSGSFPRYDFHGFNSLFDGFVNGIFQFTTNEVSPIVDLVKVKFDFRHTFVQKTIQSAKIKIQIKGR